jgi:myo-inositol 2-dehydrogenase/D-chiro-inositol 1-dehydrogenase
MKVAVIGAGSMGSRHAQILDEQPGVDEVLVVDADPARAAAVAEHVGGRAMPHDDALEAADAVIVATPAALHAATVEAAIARGLHVLCEKPLTEELASSMALVQAAEAAGAHVEIGFHRRHDPAFVAGRARVADGSVGSVHLLRLTAFDPRVAPWTAEHWPPSEAAPILLHSSIHDFDFVRWMTGQEIVEVTTEGGGFAPGRPTDPRDVVTAVVSMRLSEGTLAVLEATWLHPAGYDNRVELVADAAHLSMGWSPRTPATLLEGGSLEGGVAELPSWAGYLDRFEEAYRAEIAAFVACCRGERPPSSSARDGLEALRVAIAATRSFVERRVVDLDEIPGAPRRGLT